MGAVEKVSAVGKMSKKQFYRKLFLGVSGTGEFSRLVCNGVDDLTPGEKASLRAQFAAAGISQDEIATDDELYKVAREITSRAVQLAKG